eukprot:3488641-Pyramimonas_sp.AAC.1
MAPCLAYATIDLPLKHEPLSKLLSELHDVACIFPDKDPSSRTPGPQTLALRVGRATIHIPWASYFWVCWSQS